MSAVFDQLVGAAGDVKELEYISALHQTDVDEVRTDASIRAEDIRLFLSSRYGIVVTEEQVLNTILKGLGGASNETDEATLDLMEVVAALLIPTLLKAAMVDQDVDEQEDVEPLGMLSEFSEILEDGMPSNSRRSSSHALPKGIVPTPPGMLNFVLQMILHDVTGNRQPKPLTIDLIQRIFVAYGEHDLAQDQALLQEMVDAATGKHVAVTTNKTQPTIMDPTETCNTLQDLSEQGLLQNAPATNITASTRTSTSASTTTSTTTIQDNTTSPTSNANGFDEPVVPPPLLNVKTFAEGLTHDIKLYDIHNENKITTNIDDVFSNNDNHDNNYPMDTVALSTTTLTQRNDIPNHQRHEDGTQPILGTEQEEESSLKRKRTFPAIDMTAGTYRSKTLIVLLWATIIISYFGFDFSYEQGFATKCEGEKPFVYDYKSPWPVNKDAMACEAGFSILTWLGEFWSMCFYGIIYVSLGSIGNSVECKRAWKPLVGCFFVVGRVVIASFAEPGRSYSMENWALYVAATCLSVATGLLHLSHAAAISYSKETLQKVQSSLPKLHRFFTGNLTAEMNVKKAAARKMALMTKNALEIVKCSEKENILEDTYYGQALGNYYRSGKKYVKAGGLAWGWRCLVSGAFTKEGIWLPARMLASNIAQYIVVIYTLLLGIALTEDVVNNFDEEWAKRTFRNFTDNIFDEGAQTALSQDLAGNVSDLVGQYISSMEAQGKADFGCTNSTTTAEEILGTYCNSTVGGTSFQCDPDAPVNYLCPLLDPSTAQSLNASSQEALLIGSGFDRNYLEEVAKEAVYRASDNSVDALYPSDKYMVVVPMVVGVILAFSTALFLAVVYLPSVNATILKLRSGLIPTLRDPEFCFYRRAPDQVALITGSIFWGTLVSGVVVGGTVGLVIFFFLWQATAVFAMKFAAILIGIITVTLLRLALVCLCRCTLYKSFYRERPAIANIGLLALEWANFALSVGFIFVRLVKLLMAAGMSIGRIDEPFLAPNVGRIGPLRLDNYPMVHLKDLLSHEAHRHPYIEQLGVIYLMKLRYASRFGKRAGTCWRLIFVYALFPWLHKYRILARPEQMTSQTFGRGGSTTDLEQQYPSLNFVSLRHLKVVDQHSDYEQNDNVKTEDGASDMSRPTTKQEITAKVYFEADSQREKDQLKILALEEENRRLRMALARRAGGLERIEEADC